ncbi:MAG: DUF58 domain-containing protein [Treponemataceae bacterium]
MEEQNAAPEIGSIFSISIFLFLLGLIFFAAAAYASAVVGAFTLTTFTATTIALMVVVRVWGRLGISRLAVELSVDRDRLFPEEIVTLRAEIDNRKLLPVRMRLELSRPENLVPTADDTVDGETGLLPFEKMTGEWTFRAARRGAYRLGPATLVAGDLMGLARKEKALPFNREIVVFPRIVPIAEVELPFRDYFGIHPSKGIIEDPAWYEGTREYSGNKPAKNIHWKASARLNVLQEKIFEPTSHRKVFFLLYGAGFLSAEDNEGFESALEIIASLASGFSETGASFAIATDCRIRAYPPVLPLGRGPEHLGKVLELLARGANEEGQALPPLVGGVNATGAGFIIVAREPDENTKKLHDLPASRRDRILFLFTEELEQ